MTVILSGFADEISPDPQAQLATLAAESISHLELRSAWSVNVADLTGGQLAAFRTALDGAGVRVSAIGSPIGKIPVSAPLAPELERMRRVARHVGDGRWVADEPGRPLRRPAPVVRGSGRRGRRDVLHAGAPD